MSIVDLAAVKAHLNIPETTTDHDVALQGFCDAAQVPVEDIAGPVVLRTITGETYDGGWTTIITQQKPIVSVISLVEYVGSTAYTLTNQPQGSTVNSYGYEVIDAIGGTILRRGPSGVPIPFRAGPAGVVLTYQAGYSTLPAHIRLGALELVRHWWQFGQQGARPGFGSIGGDDGYDAGVGPNVAVPHFVAQLLLSAPAGPRRIPGFA